MCVPSFSFGLQCARFAVCDNRHFIIFTYQCTVHRRVRKRCTTEYNDTGTRINLSHDEKLVTWKQCSVRWATEQTKFSGKIFSSSKNYLGASHVCMYFILPYQHTIAFFIHHSFALLHTHGQWHTNTYTFNE